MAHGNGLPSLLFSWVAFDLKRSRRHAALTSHGISWRHAGPRERGGPGWPRRQRWRARSRPPGIRTPVRV